MRKNKGLYITLTVVFAVVAILVVGYSIHQHNYDPHAGHNHATADPHAGHDHATTDPHAGHNHATTANPNRNQKAKDCYTFVENKDGTYSYTVTGRDGSYLLQEEMNPRPADFTPLSDNVLMVHGQAGTGLSTRWAIFCNVNALRKSRIFTYVLGAGETQVAFVDFRTDKLHVFVADQFDETIEPEAYTLEDIKLVNGEEPDIDFEQKGSTLKVTYPTKSGNKTITIKLK